MIHVISFSTGLSSALTVERVLSRYGVENCRVVFMDTLIEDDDNYRFMADCAARWARVYGLGEIVRLSDGRTPYQVFEDVQFIGNQKAAPCTFKLKIEMFKCWLAEQQGPITIHIGYDYQELHRIEATKRNYEALGYAVDFPLLWKPYETRKYSQVVREDWGIEPPRMYAMGYTHANCGGRCVKQGQGDWLRTLINFPDRFAEAEAWEAQMRDHPVRQGYAILRDQIGGDTKPLPLTELRKRNKGRISPPMLIALDEKSACVRCGIGDTLE